MEQPQSVPISKIAEQVSNICENYKNQVIALAYSHGMTLYFGLITTAFTDLPDFSMVFKVKPSGVYPEGFIPRSNSEYRLKYITKTQGRNFVKLSNPEMEDYLRKVLDAIFAYMFPVVDEFIEVLEEMITSSQDESQDAQAALFEIHSLFVRFKNEVLPLVKRIEGESEQKREVGETEIQEPKPIEADVESLKSSILNLAKRSYRVKSGVQNPESKGTKSFLRLLLDILIHLPDDSPIYTSRSALTSQMNSIPRANREARYRFLLGDTYNSKNDPPIKNRSDSDAIGRILDRILPLPHAQEFLSAALAKYPNFQQDQNYALFNTIKKLKIYVSAHAYYRENVNRTNISSDTRRLIASMQAKNSGLNNQYLAVMNKYSQIYIQGLLDQARVNGPSYYLYVLTNILTELPNNHEYYRIGGQADLPQNPTFLQKRFFVLGSFYDFNSKNVKEGNHFRALVVILRRIVLVIHTLIPVFKSELEEPSVMRKRKETDALEKIYRMATELYPKMKAELVEIGQTIRTTSPPRVDLSQGEEREEEGEPRQQTPIQQEFVNPQTSQDVYSTVPLPGFEFPADLLETELDYTQFQDLTPPYI